MIKLESKDVKLKEKNSKKTNTIKSKPSLKALDSSSPSEGTFADFFQKYTDVRDKIDNDIYHCLRYQNLDELGGTLIDEKYHIVATYKNRLGAIVKLELDVDSSFTKVSSIEETLPRLKVLRRAFRDLIKYKSIELKDDLTKLKYKDLTKLKSKKLKALADWFLEVNNFYLLLVSLVVIGDRVTIAGELLSNYFKVVAFTINCITDGYKKNEYPENVSGLMTKQQFEILMYSMEWEEYKYDKKDNIQVEKKSKKNGK